MLARGVNTRSMWSVIVIVLIMLVAAGIAGWASTVHADTEYGSLTIKKVDSKDPTKGLEGAVFLICANGDSYKPGVTSEWPLGDGSGRTIGTNKTQGIEVVTGPDGTATLEGLPLNYKHNGMTSCRYLVYEKTAPEGYLISSEQISISNGQTVQWQVDTWESSDRYSPEVSGLDATITIPNIKITYGGIEITKVDADDPTKKLEGAEFKITPYNTTKAETMEDGQEISSANPLYVTTGADGKATVSGLPKNAIGGYFYYRVTETTAPDDYLIVGGPYENAFKWRDSSVSGFSANSGRQDDQACEDDVLYYTARNIKSGTRTLTININKTGDGGEPLKDVEFDVYPSTDGEYDYGTGKISQQKPVHVKTDSNGKAVVENLPVNETSRFSYEVEETNNPNSGYENAELVTQSVTRSLSDALNEEVLTQTVNVTNKKPVIYNTSNPSAPSKPTKAVDTLMEDPSQVIPGGQIKYTVTGVVPEGVSEYYIVDKLDSRLSWGAGRPAPEVSDGGTDKDGNNANYYDENTHTVTFKWKATNLGGKTVTASFYVWLPDTRGDVIPNTATASIPNASTPSNKVDVSIPSLPTYISIPVKKDWYPEGVEKQEVEVELYNGETSTGQKLTLNEENNWGQDDDVMFTELDPDGDYSVKETTKLGDDFYTAYNGDKESGLSVANEQITVEKEVNGDKHADLKTKDEAFTYTIKAKIPENAGDIESFTVTDELEKVLEYVADSAKVTIGGNEKDVTVTEEGQTLTWELAEYCADNAGADVVITFDAKIKDGADLSDYTDETVPNKATLKVNNASATSNKVTVTPPDIPDVEKFVTTQVAPKVGKDQKEPSKLAEDNEAFTYTIETAIPKRGDSFTVSDTLEKVLEYVDGTASVKIDGEAADPAVDPSIDGKKLTWDLTAFIESNPGAKVAIEFSAKISGEATEADLEKYKVDSGEYVIPNTAKIKVGDNPEEESNVVKITPPNPEPGIEKTVKTSLTPTNNKSADAKKNDTMKYTVTTRIPLGMNSMIVTDRMDAALVYQKDAKVTIGGKTVDLKPTVKGQLLTWTFDKYKKHMGEKVEITYSAKFAETATLEQLQSGVPNDVGLEINGNPVANHKVDVKVTTKPDEPTNPGLEKFVTTEKTDMNNRHGDLAAKDEIFTYTLESKVPKNAKSFIIGDELEPVLMYNPESAEVLIDGMVATDVSPTVKGNKIVFDLSAYCSVAAGKSVTINFEAVIREGADLSGYIVDGKVQIPNKAYYSVNDKAFESNVVTVTPPTESTPPDTPDKDKGSKTGDPTMLGLLAALLMASLAGGLVVARRRRKA